MPLAVSRVSQEHADALWQFYRDVCAQQAHDAYTPQWTEGVYPSEQDIRAHVDAGELYALWDCGRPVAAMALVLHEDPEYTSVPWLTPAAPEEVAVIHLLAVHPRARGQHLGSQLVREAIRLAREANMRVIHLDVVSSNHAASRIYKAAGFTFVGPHEIFYEDTGLMYFDLYEYVL